MRRMDDRIKTAIGWAYHMVGGKQAARELGSERIAMMKRLILAAEDWHESDIERIDKEIAGFVALERDGGN